MYDSLLNYKMRKIKITNSLRRTAQRCRIEAPLKLSWDKIKDRLKMCAEKCEYFSKHEHKCRKKNLQQQRLDVMRAKSKGEVEKRTLEIIWSGKERAKWKRLGVLGVAIDLVAIKPPLKTKQYTIGLRRNAPPIDAPERA